MKKTLLFTAFLGLAMAASAEHFKVIAPLPAEAEGLMAKLVDFDSGNAIDSVVVKDKCARFEGAIDDDIRPSASRRCAYSGIHSRARYYFV